MTARLTFDALRAANNARSPHFKNARGVVNDSDVTFSLSDLVTALCGEVGEAANIVKKILRGDYTLDDVYSAKTETAWLVEDRHPQVTYYLAGHHRWTGLPDRATRFARQEDAEAFKSSESYVVAEHMWVGPSITVREALAKEFADAQCYLDKLAKKAGVDLGEATVSKFDEVSDRIGSTVKLGREAL